MTPISGAEPYCDAATALQYHDWRQWADLCSDSDSRGNTTTIVDSGAADGAKLLQLLRSASGEVEEWCLKGGRYAPTDLAALTGNSQARLQELVADLAFWRATKRRWPDASHSKVAGAEDAEKALVRLGSGETIFGLIEAIEASNPSVTTLDPGDDRRTVRAASRMFGNREPRGRDGRG